MDRNFPFLVILCQVEWVEGIWESQLPSGQPSPKAKQLGQLEKEWFVREQKSPRAPGNQENQPTKRNTHKPIGDTKNAGPGPEPAVFEKAKSWQPRCVIEIPFFGGVNK